jgi:hypothetical protein
MLVSTGAAARYAITVTALALGTAGCGNPQAPQGCTTQFVYGLSVIVQDKATGQQICDAQVTAVSGSYVETLQPLAFQPDCSYVGAGERQGVYTISVAKDGYAPATRNSVRVDKDYCHVIPVRVTIALDR